MRVQLEHHTHRYRAPLFVVTTSQMGRARRELLGRSRVILGDEQFFFPNQEIGESIADLAQRHEKLRFELVARKLMGERLSSEEEAVLSAINAGLRESMVEPTPESEQVKAAVEMAKSLLAQRVIRRSHP
jgi:hypothetical protein